MAILNSLHREGITKVTHQPIPRKDRERATWTCGRQRVSAMGWQAQRDWGRSVPGMCRGKEGGMTETGVRGRRVGCHVTGVRGRAGPIGPYGVNYLDAQGFLILMNGTSLRSLGNKVDRS